MANSTANTILGLAYGEAKVDSTTISTPGLQTTQMLQCLHDANAEWREIFRISGEPSEAMKKEYGFTLLADTTLTNAAVTSDVQITIGSASGYATSGVIAIWDETRVDIIEYGFKSSITTLDTLSGMDWDHAAGEDVTYLYALPSNFEDFRRTEDAAYGVLVNGIPYSLTSGVPTYGQFSLYDNGTTEYIMFPKGTTGDVVIYYNKSSTTIDDTSDVVDVPVKHQSFLVYRLVDHIYRIKREFQVADYYKNKANEALIMAQKTKNAGKFFRTRSVRRAPRYGDLFSITDFTNS